MAKKADIVGFTPTGTVYKSTNVPKATTKTHKQLGLSDQQVVDMYESMQLQRRFEERSAQMYQKGKFGGFLHLYIGQEAISTGTVTALNDDDDLITAYRDHGHALARGATANECMAEMYGKSTGLSKGKGGSMHFFKLEKHMWGGHAIVGAHIPLAAGIAMANKYQENGRIVVCFFGDGAIDQGSVNETFNMAQLWKLPVIFVVENNGYSMGTAVERHSAGELHKRACPYDMKSAIVNGLDAFSVYEKFKEVAADVRENNNPWFLEVRTYRYRGHSMSDPQKYRTKEEMEEFKTFDPIERLKDYILKKKIATQDDLTAIDERLEKTVLDSIDFAEESPFPELEDLYKHVYVEDDFPWTT
jgi:pyruvate dehydrogenase E1 component alpha subunit